MEFLISEMTIGDYDEMAALWNRCEGIGLSSADERAPMQSFLIQNKGFCFTARVDHQLAGTVLCGSDGRRGYLYHLAVDLPYRRMGIGRALVECSLSELSRRGVQKCHLMVFAENLEGQSFWSRIGWVFRPEILTMSRDLATSPDSGSCPC